MTTSASNVQRFRIGTAQVAVALLAMAAAVAVAPTPAGAAVETKRIVVLLCKFQDRLDEPQPKSYYENFYTAAGGDDLGAWDFYNDVSYGNLDLQVTVTDWITVPLNRHVFTGAGSPKEWCADPGGVDLSQYDGVIVVPNLTSAGDPPSTNPISTTLTQPVAEGDTTIEVTSSAGFPVAPFPAWIGGAYVDGVNVTAVDGTTWTVERDYPDSREPQDHPAGDAVVFFSVARFQGSTGIAWLPADADVTSASHEMVHLLGFEHSRKLSTSTTDYNDCWDIGSAVGCVYRFNGAYDLNGFNRGFGGPGMNAANIDSRGWFIDRKTTFDNSTCRSQTYRLPALNHPEVSGPLTVLVPASVVITNAADADGNPTSTTTSNNYYIEFRHKSGWDRNIPADSVVLHLDGGGDGHSYWVDTAGNGALVAGNTFVDSATNTYLAVNEIDSAAMNATVTVGSCTVPATLSWSGDTSGDFTDDVTLAADLTVNGAPIPNAEVNLTLGSQSCPAGTKTDAQGHASCTVRLAQTPGSYAAAASYAGNDVYQGASASPGFTIEREQTALAYTGATTGVYSDPSTVSAKLVDADDSAPLPGRTITFSLGATDTCQDATDAAGVASCSLTPTLRASQYPLTVTFAGDTYFDGTAAQVTFTVTKETTTLALADSTTGGFAGNGDSLTLTATLAEDDGPPVSNRTVVFTLGGPQSCTGTTSTAGIATCTIAAVDQAQGPTTVTAAFAEDAYYLASSDQASVTIFTWTLGGNFVIGDGTASTGATATFWTDDWYLRNSVSGGAAPKAFKGFANVPDGRTTCGGTWKATGGNSPPPANSVSGYTAVLVTGKVTKAGTTITGTKPHIAIVLVNPGYAPSPGHPGTATVLGLYC